ncbi:MAG: hypothetical protein CMO80_00310 [Verrucomicrobiales bacterium]|nr:hypothetical protein [Verrucomicrobiales bacterium]
MKIREPESVKVLLASGAKIFDLYDLMDRAGTVTFRFTKRYINIPLTAAATGLFGNQFAGDGTFDWNALIYTPLIIVAAIGTVGFALKLPSMLSAAKRTYARIQGQINMMQLKRNRRDEHATVLWERHFKYHTLAEHKEAALADNEADYLKTRNKVVEELEKGLSFDSIDHLELENTSGPARRQALHDLVLAMEYETPTSAGVESCEAAFFRTFIYSLRSDESQKNTQEKSGYVFREYKSWLRRTFFDPTDVPLSARLKKHMRLNLVTKQLKGDGVTHDPRVKFNWYVFPGTFQSFWHSNTTRKVSIMVGAVLSGLGKKYNTHLTVQSVLWPGNYRHDSFQIKAKDGKILGDELHEAGRMIMRSVYGQDADNARHMLDRATLNNFVQVKGLRVLCDSAYCTSELGQNYLDDLKAMNCSETLFEYHQETVKNATAAMKQFEEWLKENRPEILESQQQLAALRDAFHRNWNGLREKLGFPAPSRFNINRSLARCLRRWLRCKLRKVDALIDYISSDEGVRSFNEDRDAIRMYDCLAHLERDTYEDLIFALAEYDPKEVAKTEAAKPEVRSSQPASESPTPAPAEGSPE